MKTVREFLDEMASLMEWSGDRDSFLYYNDLKSELIDLFNDVQAANLQLEFFLQLIRDDFGIALQRGEEIPVGELQEYDWIAEHLGIRKNKQGEYFTGTYFIKIKTRKEIDDSGNEWFYAKSFIEEATPEKILQDPDIIVDII
jgi:hypothetical protein